MVHASIVLYKFFDIVDSAFGVAQIISHSFEQIPCYDFVLWIVFVWLNCYI